MIQEKYNLMLFAKHLGLSWSEMQEERWSDMEIMSGFVKPAATDLDDM